MAKQNIHFLSKIFFNDKTDLRLFYFQVMTSETKTYKSVCLQLCDCGLESRPKRNY